MAINLGPFINQIAPAPGCPDYTSYTAVIDDLKTFQIAATNAVLRCLWVSDTGLKGVGFYTADPSNTRYLFIGTFASAFDISTFTIDNALNVNTTFNAFPNAGIHVNEAGTHIFANNSRFDVVHITLATPWDSSTATMDKQSYNTLFGYSLAVINTLFAVAEDGLTGIYKHSFNVSTTVQGEFSLLSAWNLSSIQVDTQAFETLGVTQWLYNVKCANGLYGYIGSGSELFISKFNGEFDIVPEADSTLITLPNFANAYAIAGDKFYYNGKDVDTIEQFTFQTTVLRFIVEIINPDSYSQYLRLTPDPNITFDSAAYAEFLLYGTFTFDSGHVKSFTTVDYPPLQTPSIWTVFDYTPGGICVDQGSAAWYLSIERVEYRRPSGCVFIESERYFSDLGISNGDLVTYVPAAKI